MKILLNAVLLIAFMAVESVVFDMMQAYAGSLLGDVGLFGVGYASFAATCVIAYDVGIIYVMDSGSFSMGRNRLYVVVWVLCTTLGAVALAHHGIIVHSDRDLYAQLGPAVTIWLARILIIVFLGMIMFMSKSSDGGEI